MQVPGLLVLPGLFGLETFLKVQEFIVDVVVVLVGVVVGFLPLLEVVELAGTQIAAKFCGLVQNDGG